MKICIVTWYRANNYGTCLQAFALDKYLELLGNDTVMLDYFLNIDFKNPKDLFKIFEKLYQKVYLKHLESKEKSRLSLEAYSEAIKQKEKKINKFVDSVHKFTQISCLNELRQLNDVCDCFITGSDQIWNPERISRNCLLEFVDDNKIKIAYSSSFGVSQLNFYWKKLYKRLLSRFQYIGVREIQGLNIINELQINIKPKCVMDPVFLLSKRQWIEMFNLENVKNDYILCYFVGKQQFYWEYSKKYKKEFGCEVVIVPVNEEDYYREGKIVADAGPKDFLNLIKNSKFVITDSFHALAFSLIFEKQFIVCKRFEDKQKGSQNSRIVDILKKIQLESRFVSKHDIVNQQLESIDYSIISEKLCKEITESKSFLDEALSNKF